MTRRWEYREMVDDAMRDSSYRIGDIVDVKALARELGRRVDAELKRNEGEKPWSS